MKSSKRDSKREKIKIVSFVLGVVSFCCFVSAIVFMLSDAEIKYKVILTIAGWLALVTACVLENNE